MTQMEAEAKVLRRIGGKEENELKEEMEEEKKVETNMNEKKRKEGKNEGTRTTTKCK